MREPVIARVIVDGDAVDRRLEVDAEEFVYATDHRPSTIELEFLDTSCRLITRIDDWRPDPAFVFLEGDGTASLRIDDISGGDPTVLAPVDITCVG